MRVLVLVDGEHYPPVTRWGIDAARARGHEVLAALLLGGSEKLPLGAPPDLGVPVREAGPDPLAALAEAIDEVRPDGVLDLSDEPVAGYRARMDLAAVTLHRGLPYLGADFRFEPPIFGPPLPVPSVAVIGTGKRCGKTAVTGLVARVAAAEGLRPVVVAMGRGGPPEPVVIEGGVVDLEYLRGLSAEGLHAASDYLEDALTTGLTTVGARRCGGGIAGAPFVSNVREAANAAVETGAGLVVLEGSGSAVPTMPWDAGILVHRASDPQEHLAGYLGPLRILLSDLVLATMTNGSIGPDVLSTLRSRVERLHRGTRVVATDFEPHPLTDLRGRRVFLTTTAAPGDGERQAARLEAAAGCEVVGVSNRLADRAGLAEDLARAPGFEVLATELKAAAIDVAAEVARERGAEVVFVDNRPVAVEGEPDLAELIEEVLERAVERHG